VPEPLDEAMTTAVVVDELSLVRAGISALLAGRGIDVIGESRAAKEAASLATFDHPDLVVCGTPADLPVAEAARRFTKLRPAPMLVVLLPPAADDSVRYFLALGVRGIGLRTGDTEEIGRLIDNALKGEHYVVPALHGALSGAVRLPRLADREQELLSAREREVLVLLAEGRTNREIAASLSVTLEASNRNECLGRAVSLGLLA
jgi:two-component system, NarL family, response regulator LiaR